MKSVEEEGIAITYYGDLISKDLKVFYNPVMKLNRDMSMLLIKSYFKDKIAFCDPMIATGIREVRFLKTIPEYFESMVLGDISKTALEDAQKNFKENNIPTKNVTFMHENAINTIASQFFHFIEVDPFGSPVPFLDIAIQRIKHNGILSVTATDTAALCGTYPKKTLRRYGIHVQFLHCYEELGLRNLISYCIKEAAKHDKTLEVMISYSSDHYYKIFFKVQDGAQKALDDIKKLQYYTCDKNTQEITFSEFRTSKEHLGPIYTDKLKSQELVDTMISNLHLLNDKKKIEKLLTLISKEIEQFGYFNTHKLQKSFKIGSQIKFSQISEKLESKGFEVSKPHNNRLGIKSNCEYKDILDILKENKDKL
jgi:tRNA (guanine26-N2/guanine27-N2)-dimethyltransferase